MQSFSSVKDPINPAVLLILADFPVPLVAELSNRVSLYLKNVDCFLFCYFRSAPASPTHGLQFHAPSAPVSHVSRENSPTKTVAQTADASISQAKPTPTSPPTIPPAGLPPPAPALTLDQVSQAAVKSALPFQPTAAAQVPGAPFAVSVIKSSLAAVKENEGADTEKNGFSQSSGEESPVESVPQLESKMAAVSKPLGVQLVKQQVPSQIIVGAAAPSSGKSASVLVSCNTIVCFGCSKS